MSGAKAGRIVALVKDETLIGRAGVQVVALRRTPDEVPGRPDRGRQRRRASMGYACVPEGQSLAIGDVLEIAGVEARAHRADKRTSA